MKESYGNTFLSHIPLTYKDSDTVSGLSAYALLKELLQCMPPDEILNRLFIHKGTFLRWLKLENVPDNYYNDINHLLGSKYSVKDSYRARDQFFTTPVAAQYCYDKTIEVLNTLEINSSEYTFIEPSAGCCNFYRILPKSRRIGIDIEPEGELAPELTKINYLDYNPKTAGKYIVIGNPPFGLRGNLALRFVNHSYGFADMVAFILPPLFDSTGKGVPMTRVRGYKLAHTEKLPLDSFCYPNGEPVEVATIFQVWTKVNIEKVAITPKKQCKSFMRVYSLSDGGTPSSTRNKNMLDKCDVYLPSTCFSGMRAYISFEELPNRRGYGVVFLKNKKELKELFFTLNWQEVAFLSTNSAVNLRTDLIENELIKRGFYS
ncbi:hypothetical protein AGMMS49941_05840 [Deferribacterales bacterium]|nr:hypothetical protein AGMMS49941_05840 [Deferribacterales bacterium]